eukprot:Hpha_TRINITY_DN16665_c0_g13::TRINITY_DN16665_c0_g13_i1::g.182220::m.182220/K14572/MDN1, REA1; midasin
MGKRGGAKRKREAAASAAEFFAGVTETPAAQSPPPQPPAEQPVAAPQPPSGRGGKRRRVAKGSKASSAGPPEAAAVAASPAAAPPTSEPLRPEAAAKRPAPAPARSGSNKKKRRPEPSSTMPSTAPRSDLPPASADSSAPASDVDLVLTPSTQDNLSALRDMVAVQRCVLLSGAVGSGKSALAHHLAAEQDAELVVVGLDSSVDVKDLVGTFRGTRGGEFEFQFGPLSRAVREGHWILLEDVDLASPDVATALVAILQRGVVYVPELDLNLPCPDGFRLLGTVQKGGNQLGRGSASHWSLWSVVPILAPPLSEQFQCLAAVCPGVNPALLQSAQEAVEAVLGEQVAGCRDVTSADLKKLLPRVRLSLRELLRWGRRMRVRRKQCAAGEYIDSNTRDIALLEAADVWCRHLPSTKGFETMTRVLGGAFGVGSEKQDYLLESRKPELAGPGVDGRVICGRQVLTAADGLPIPVDSTFAETKAALGLLERLAVCVSMSEPVLLTGETGVGKTYMVQTLAAKLGEPLVVHNMNQQSESSDLLGGYRPADVAPVGAAAAEAVKQALTASYPASDQKTAAVLEKTSQMAVGREWTKLLTLGVKVAERTRKALGVMLGKAAAGSAREVGTMRKLALWDAADTALGVLKDRLEEQGGEEKKACFEWVEGSLMKCFREGSWLLLDEVNLADAEILERLGQAVDLRSIRVSDEGATAKAKITLPERSGPEATVNMHPNFRLFACMNPPTDVGKKDLPPSLKGRFTELYCDELTDRADLRVVVGRLIGSLVASAPVDEVVEFYLQCRKKAAVELTDNDPSTPRPHYSLRTLTRALRFTRQVLPVYGFKQALLEGVALCFYSQLSRRFHPAMNALVSSVLLRGQSIPTPQPPPSPGDTHVVFEHMWIEKGPEPVPEEVEYVITPSVRDHLRNLARVVVANRAVLLQGPTAAGKTSMVDFLARATGHKCVRINNHETTDIQEYMGQYLADDSGRLRFFPGPLVEACKKGYWVILDELNLAPSEILEALNRLLDDNRELLVPETMEVVRPHSHFRLFATQNPPGLYGGRKQLSRAVRNRFMEILVDDIPREELKTILSKRYKMAESMADRMVQVMTALQMRRQGSAVLSGKHGYVTPRDLFRWAMRGPFDYDGLACHGLFLLGDRCRRPAERAIVREVLEDKLKAVIPPDDVLYDPTRWDPLRKHWERFQAMGENELDGALGGGKLVPTREFRRLFTLVGLCLHYQEPFVLVGETGGGKTTVCQLWAYLLSHPVTIVNCHQHSETADFLGAYRPATPQRRAEGVLFDWHDGPLVAAMKGGGLFMLDEVSLADDAVLERLNSAFEPGRTLTLPEKGGGEMEVVKAVESFRVMATMNPAGDFGKKELSPALRNRMTELYVTSLSKQADLEVILSGRLDGHAKEAAELLVGFLTHFQEKEQRQISIRDVMSVIRFISRASHPTQSPLRSPLSLPQAYVQGVDAVLLAGLAIGTGMTPGSAAALRDRALHFVGEQVQGVVPRSALEMDATRFWTLSGMPPPELLPEQKGGYSFCAPTTQRNLSALLRALWVLDGRAGLLEGSPGVGKTTLVQTLGAALGKKVFRINLSEQTDISDLVGAFLPSEGGDGPGFRWSDGVLLQAMAEGEWVVLDELNLASQSVLEGLNALLDHRGELFVPELGKAFRPSQGFRLFGCQNPLGQGGGRKGLPRSFLNRFTRVWVEPFCRQDLVQITEAVFPDVGGGVLGRVVDCVALVDKRVCGEGRFGRIGGPWEFNLRDTFRWLELIRDGLPPWFGFQTVIQLRFRTPQDRAQAGELFSEVFGDSLPVERPASLAVHEGSAMAVQGCSIPLLPPPEERETETPVVAVLPSLIPALASVVAALHKNSMVLLTGPTGAGKSRLVELAAHVSGGRMVRTFPLSSGTDTMDLLGQFQQRGGGFAWTDSLLVKALEKGEWLILDNAGFASPSVLDRLNGLLEPRGELVLNECGLGTDGQARVIRPHPAFRVFLLLDPRTGSVSRAMRNRGVEVYLPALDSRPGEAGVIASFDAQKRGGGSSVTSSPEEAVRSVGQRCVRSEDLAIITEWHAKHVQRLYPSAAWVAGRPTLSTVLRCGHLSEHLRGKGKPAGLKDAIFQCYLRGLGPAVRASEERELEAALKEVGESPLPVSTVVTAFSCPAAGLDDCGALLRALVIAIAPRGASSERLRLRLAAVAHHLGGKDSDAQRSELLSAALRGASGDIATVLQRLQESAHGVAACSSSEHKLRLLDSLPLGRLPEGRPGSIGRLPFAAALLRAVAESADPEACEWGLRDRAVASVLDLDAATAALGRHAKKPGKQAAKKRSSAGSWRAVAGAAAPLADLIPETAPDAVVLEWLHCWLRVQTYATRLGAATKGAVQAALDAFGVAVGEHFGLSGDPRPPLLWKQEGRPPPCPPELRGALEKAEVMRRQAREQEPRFQSPLAPAWQVLTGSLALAALPDAVTRGSTPRPDICAAVCRLASVRGGSVAADCLPLRLAVEAGQGGAEELRHPVVEALVRQLLHNATAPEPSEVMLSTDPLAALLLRAPGPILFDAARAVTTPSAAALVSEGAVARAAIDEALSVAIAFPSGPPSPASSLTEAGIRLLTATLQVFADKPGRPEAALREMLPRGEVLDAGRLRELAQRVRVSDGMGADAIEALAGAVEAPTEALALCRAGCSLGLVAAWRIHLLRPASPLDPALRAEHKARSLREWLQKREGELLELTEIESLLRGVVVADPSLPDGWSPPVSALSSLVETIRTTAGRAAEKAVHRRGRAEGAIDKFPALFWQLRQAATTHLTQTRVVGTATRLTALAEGSAPRIEEVEAALQQAEMMCGSASRLREDLESKYAGYEDITAGLRAAASLIQVGFGAASRAVAALRRSASSPKLTQMLHGNLPSLLGPPSAAVSGDIGEELRTMVVAAFDPSAPEARDGASHWRAVQSVLAILRVWRLRAALGFAAALGGGERRHALFHVEGVYAAWVRLWDVVEEEEKRRAEKEAEQFKWRSSTQEIEGDDEALARTLRELFPSYAEEFEPAKDQDEGEDAKATEKEEELVAGGVRKMRRTLLGQGELLDVVLEYVTAVSDTSQEHFAFSAPPSGALVGPSPTERALRARKRKRKGDAGDERAKRARQLLLASQDQLEDDALPQVPAPDESVAAALLDTSEADLVRKRLLIPTLRPAAFAAQFNAVSLLLKTGPGKAPQLVGPMAGPTAVSAAVTSLAAAKKRLSQAAGGVLSDDVTDRVRSGFNIYQEADLAEALHGLRPVAVLKVKVAELLAEFPDHPPLINLMDIVGKVLDLDPAQEPLMKVLQGAELVLKAAHEWETTAHRGVSVAANITAIGSSILRWRRLELHCWPHLLHARRRLRGENASRDAFLLWKVCDGALQGREQEQGAGLAGAVQSFVRSAGYGDFEVRVRLLAAHGQRLALASRETGALAGGVGKEVMNTFLNISAFYSSWMGSFLRTFGIEAKEIRKKLAEFIKIQRWQDANYYALTASTTKSHHEIAKVLQKWDKLLAKPVAAWMEEQYAALDEKLAFPDEGATIPPQAPGFKLKQGKGLRVAVDEPASPMTIAVIDAASHSACCEGSSGFLSSATSTVARMCDSIVSRVAELQPPAKVKRTVKMRALLSLLETLRDGGLELGTDGKQGRQLQWEEQGILKQTDFPLALSAAASDLLGGAPWPAAAGGERERRLWLSAERDFYRLMQSQRRLQEAAQAPGSGDVNLAQLQRMRRQAGGLWEAVRFQRSTAIPAAADTLSRLNSLCTTASSRAEAEQCTEALRSASRLEQVCREVSEVCMGAGGDAAALAALCADTKGGMTVRGGDAALRALDAEGRRELSELADACSSAASALSAARSRKQGAATAEFAAQACSILSVALARCRNSHRAVVSGLASHVDAPAVAAEKRLRAAGQRGHALSLSEEDQAKLKSVCDIVLRPARLPPRPDGGKAGEFDALEEAGLWRCNRAIEGWAGQVVDVKGAVPEGMSQRVMEARDVAELRFRELVQYHASLVRMALLVTRLYGTLLKRGFCGSGKDEDDESGDGEDGDGKGGGDLKEGTGMDDGQGAKDVSNELENEDQLMSAKDMEKQEEDKKKDGKDDGEEDEEDQGVNVDTNFEGELEDTKKKRDEDEEDQSSEGSKEEGAVDGDDQEETKQEQKADAGEDLRDAEGDGKKEKQEKDKFEEEKEEDEDEDEQGDKEGGWDNKDLDEKLKDDQDKAEEEGEAELMAKEGELSEDGEDEEGDADKEKDQDKEGADEDQKAEEEEKDEEGGGEGEEDEKKEGEEEEKKEEE